MIQNDDTRSKCLNFVRQHAIIWLSVATLLSAPVGRTNECEDAMAYLDSSPEVSKTIQITQVEELLNVILHDFFSDKPIARRILRRTLNSASEGSIEVANALESLLSKEKINLIKASLNRAISEGLYSGAVKFRKDLFVMAVENGYRPAFNEIAYDSYIFEDLISALKSSGISTRVVKGGRKEYAIVYYASETKFFRYDRSADRDKVIPLDSKSSFDQWKAEGQPSFFEISMKSKDNQKRLFDFLHNLPGTSLFWMEYTLETVGPDTLSALNYILSKNPVPFSSGIKNITEYRGETSHFVNEIIEEIWSTASQLGYKYKFTQSKYFYNEINEAVHGIWSANESFKESQGAESKQIQPLTRRMAIGGDHTNQYTVLETSDGKTLHFKVTGTSPYMGDGIATLISPAAFRAWQASFKADLGGKFIEPKRVPSISPAAKIDHFPNRLKTIPQDQIADVEFNLNPGVTSLEGFKKPYEDYNEIVFADLVAAISRGIAPQHIARWMSDIAKQAESEIKKENSYLAFQGQNYEVEVWDIHGHRQNPFGDPIYLRHKYMVTNLATGRQITFTDLQIYMIGNYGFFGGDVPSRLSPVDLINFMAGR